MKSKQDTFASLMDDFQYHFDKAVVFDDFLTMTIASFGQNPLVKLSYDEELYLEAIGKYKHHKLVDHIPKLLTCLIMEMEEQIGSSSGNDVLGTYYEQNFSKKGSQQFFTPWHICQFMASTLGSKTSEEPLRILDPCCGSGRMLVCGANHLGKQHYYFGIDIDHTCVKMTALNLFLNGVLHGEVMWADALSPNDFRMCYKLSYQPFGIFRLTDKEHSYLWHCHKNSFYTRSKGSSLSLPSEDGDTANPDASQLTLF